MEIDNYLTGLGKEVERHASDHSTGPYEMEDNYNLVIADSHLFAAGHSIAIGNAMRTFSLEGRFLPEKIAILTEYHGYEKNNYERLNPFFDTNRVKIFEWQGNIRENDTVKEYVTGAITDFFGY